MFTPDAFKLIAPTFYENANKPLVHTKPEGKGLGSGGMGPATKVLFDKIAALEIGETVPIEANQKSFYEMTRRWTHEPSKKFFYGKKFKFTRTSATSFTVKRIW